MQDNSTFWIVVILIAVHFVVGVGWIFFKIVSAKPTKEQESKEKSAQL